jgi:hypothetical protein
MVGGLGSLLILLFVLVLLLPQFINQEAIREKVQTAISREVGGEVKFETLDLSFFPLPHLVIHKGSVSISENMTGTVESVSVYPKILPLLVGKLRMSEIRIEAPDLHLRSAAEPESNMGPPNMAPLENIKEEMAQVLAFMASEAPGADLIVERGELSLSGEEGPIFRFENIQASIELPPEKLSVDIRCQSSLWDNMIFTGWIDQRDLKAEGHLELTHFRPENLTGLLLDDEDTLKIGESEVNLNIRFTTDGLGDLQAELKGSAPEVTVQKPDGELVLKCKDIRAALHMDKDKTSVSEVALDLDYPKLKLSGKFEIDRLAPWIDLELEGSEVDVPSSRDVALSLLGDVEVVQTIFNLVRGGRVPQITFRTYGSSWDEFGSTENIDLTGNILEGKVFVPEVELDLEEVKGKAVISGGFIVGEELEARLESEQGREGWLRSGLEGDDHPFHVEIVVESDLTSLPSLLKRVIKNEDVVREITRTHDIKGRVIGKLVLGETIDSIEAEEDIWDLELSARHESIPYPLAVHGGSMSFDEDENRIGFANLSGTFGKSSFSELTAQLNFDELMHVDVQTAKARVVVDEIFSWLSSLEELKVLREDFKAVKGQVVLSDLNLKGPMLEPSQWHFRAAGRVENLVAERTSAPDSIAVANGRFEVTPEKISVSGFQTNILDASLNASGVLSGFLEKIQSVDATFQGDLGSEAIKWLSEAVSLPPGLRVRAPLSISEAHLVWAEDRQTSFRGDLAVKEGPQVSLDIFLDPNELKVTELLIQDGESNASFALDLKEKERELHLEFVGDLEKTTMDRLLTDNQILAGRIEGDFHAHILLEQPMRSTGHGRLKVEDFDSPWRRVPLTLENISLYATENQLDLESVLITWEEEHLALKGKVKLSEEGFLIDMDLSSDKLEWARIEEILNEEDHAQDRVPEKQEWFLPLRGLLRVRSDSFQYEDSIWEPFHADVTFDRNRVTVEVTEADLCGISTPGVLSVTPTDLSLEFRPAVAEKELDPALECILGEKVRITGTFDLNGEITADGKPEDLVNALKGNVEFLANEGRIYHLRTFVKVFAYLNVTEILRGKLPDLSTEGFGYKSASAELELQDGKVFVKEGIIDGTTMEIVCNGEVDLIEENLNLKVLVAPLKTVDFVVKLIPGLSYLLGGNLVAIPMKVTGDLKDPQVKPLPTTAIGGGLTEVLKRTVQIPVKIVKPATKDEGEEDQETSSDSEDAVE